MICFYHSRDLDGACSGAIVKKKYPDATLIGYDYGQPFPWDSINGLEPVIMVDVSLPMADMFKLHNKSNFQLTWIDHHSSAIADFKAYCESSVEYTDHFITAVLEDGISACEGAWKYLFPDDLIPKTVELLGRYDTWRKDEEWESVVLPFQFGMRLRKYKADDFPQYLLANTHNYSILEGIIANGNIILNYQSEQNAAAMRGSFVIDFMGLRVLACNNGGFNSQAFESIWDEEKHDAMMPFRFNGKFWVCSLYTTKDIDLSVKAKELGGGGHKKACGFQCDHIFIDNSGDGLIVDFYTSTTRIQAIQIF